MRLIVQYFKFGQSKGSVCMCVYVRVIVCVHGVHVIVCVCM